MRPNNGEKEPNTHKTEVKLVYDDEASICKCFNVLS